MRSASKKTKPFQRAATKVHSALQFRFDESTSVTMFRAPPAENAARLTRPSRVKPRSISAGGRLWISEIHGWDFDGSTIEELSRITPQPPCSFTCGESLTVRNTTEHKLVRAPKFEVLSRTTEQSR